MNTLFNRLAVVSLLSFSLFAHAVDKPAAVKFCYEDENVYPWVLKDRPGLNILLMNSVEKILGVKVELVQRPWKRCQAELKNGEVDGIFSASYKKERLELGVYPMAGDKLDESKAVMIDSYSLYRIKGSSAQWDGKKLSINGLVGAQSGYSIIEQLKGLGAKVDDGTGSADNNLLKLLAGRVEAVALQTLEGDDLVARTPTFATKVEKVTPALVVKPFYLMLSKQFNTRFGDFSKEIWAAVAQVRDSADFKSKARDFK
jgi:polar amino acid transport system substrate-binding protein